MLLLTDLTSAPDDNSIGIEYCQKIREVSPIPISISCANTQLYAAGAAFLQTELLVSKVESFLPAGVS